MLIFIVAGTFGTVALLVLGLTMRSERDIVQERMRVHSSAGEVTATSIDTEMAVPFGERVVMPLLRKLGRIAGSATPSGALRALDDKLETAGRPWNLGAREFMGLRVLSIAVLTLVGVLFASLVRGNGLLTLFALGICVFIGVILPDSLLQSVINARQSAVRRALPDILDLLTVSVEAGLGLDGAVQKVVEKFHNPLSEELDRALQEIRVGKLRADALKSMAQRVKVHELSAFVAAICQADQLGVSIANVLHVQSETFRSQRAQRARETAAKLPVKMLVPLVFCIFPAIFVVILGPAAIRIMRAFDFL